MVEGRGEEGKVERGEMYFSCKRAMILSIFADIVPVLNVT